MKLKKLTQQTAHDKFYGKTGLFGDARDAFVYNTAIDDMENHVPDAGKMATETDQAIEKARKNKACDLAGNFYAGSNYPNVRQITTHEVWELMADFAIEYAREKERESFEAGYGKGVNYDMDNDPTARREYEKWKEDQQ